MNWIKANKFLAGLLVVAVLGIGALGYLLWNAMDQANSATEEFNKQAAEYKRLRTLPTYPNQANLNTLEEQRKEHQDKIDALQAQLASMEGPTEALGPVPFQDRLRQSVSDIDKKASQAGLKLPGKEADKPGDKFYMGMGRYQATPPRPEAAPLLGRELKAMEFLMSALMDARVSELAAEPEREEFPEENGAAPKATPPPKPGVKSAAPPVELVKKHAIALSIVTDQLPLQKFLNAVASAKVNFLVIRNVQITNEVTTGPSRQASAGSASTPTPPPPDPNAPPPPPNGSPSATPAPVGIQYIVGQEKVRATIIIELTDFAPVTGANQAGATKPGQAKPGAAPKTTAPKSAALPTATPSAKAPTTPTP